MTIRSLLRFWIATTTLVFIKPCWGLDQRLSSISDETHAAMLGRVEASIMGESALIDRETGRVFWEGGSTNTLYESVAPKLDQYGAEHTKAAFMTALITLAFFGVIAGWLRRGIDQADQLVPSDSSLLPSILLTGLQWTILRLPRLENKWLVLASVALYFFESYNCSTRRFLANAISGPTELEEYIESLRRNHPIVTWRVRSFHYERRKIFSLATGLQSILRRFKQDSDLDSLALRNAKHCSPMFPFTRKVITNEAATTYQYGGCLDSTIAGMWRRAEDASATTAPFTKIALTKLLVLSDRKSREDYFTQQSEFVTQHGRGDEHVEFSTDIQVAGFRPRMLAVRPVEGVSSAKLFRLHLFWMITFLGMTLPYRIWFKRHCDFLRVTVVKETSANSASTSSWATTRKWLPSRANIRPYGASENSVFRSFMQGQSLYSKKSTSMARKSFNSRGRFLVVYNQQLNHLGH